jgi:Fungal specific transcription factor domain
MPNSVRQTHPSVEDRLELWQVFVENVNSLLKIVHEPTVQLEIKKDNLQIHSMPKNSEALVFSIYSAAVMSMTEPACVERFGESRKVLLRRYSTATKTALSRAKFLGTRDIVVLQAFLLHVISMRSVYDPQTAWTLMGIAGRLAEGMGLQRDGTHLGLPPFDTEIRRRVWWQIKMLDSKFAEPAGLARLKNISPDPQLTHIPSNINDDQLYPGMLSSPVESEGFTDMCFCCLMGEFIHFWTTHSASMRAQHGKDVSLWDNYGSNSDITEKDEAINQLERILENKYIRHCDPTRPAQLITLIMARTATNHMHFIAHHPRRWGRDQDIPESERQYVWNLAIKQLETEITIRSNHQFDRFTWYLSSFTPWAQTIHILDCLQATPLLQEAAKGWRLIGELFNLCPDFMSNNKFIYVALGNLCIKAYNARTVALRQRGTYIGKTPNYITTLRAQREGAIVRGRDQGVDQRRWGIASQSRITASGYKTSLDGTWQPNTTLESSTPQIFSENLLSTRPGDQSTYPNGAIYEQTLSNGGESTGSLANVTDNTTTLLASMNDSMTVDTNVLLGQADYINNLNIESIDWDQWDTFLQDWNGSLPER